MTIRSRKRGQGPIAICITGDGLPVVRTGPQGPDDTDPTMPCTVYADSGQRSTMPFRLYGGPCAHTIGRI